MIGVFTVTEEKNHQSSCSFWNSRWQWNL